MGVCFVCFLPTTGNKFSNLIYMGSKGNLYISDFSRKKKNSRRKLKETNSRPIEVQLPNRAECT